MAEHPVCIRETRVQFSHGPPMILDIAFGIFGAIIFSNIMKTELSLFLVLFGIISTLLVDINLFPFIKSFKLNKYHHKHREFLHYPLLFLPIGFFGILISLNLPLAIFFTISVLFHFIHDSIGIGWGIQWLYPFSKKYYKFFSDEKNELSTRFMIIRTPEEQKAAVEKYGRNDWLKHYYLRPTIISITEYTAFVIAIMALISKIFS